MDVLYVYYIKFLYSMWVVVLTTSNNYFSYKVIKFHGWGPIGHLHLVDVSQ